MIIDPSTLRWAKEADSVTMEIPNIVEQLKIYGPKSKKPEVEIVQVDGDGKKVGDPVPVNGNDLPIKNLKGWAYNKLRIKFTYDGAGDWSQNEWQSFWEDKGDSKLDFDASNLPFIIKGKYPAKYSNILSKNRRKVEEEEKRILKELGIRQKFSSTYLFEFTVRD